MESRYNVPEYISDAFEKGECAIGRCYGQTMIFIPQRYQEERVMKEAERC